VYAALPCPSWAWRLRLWALLFMWKHGRPSPRPCVGFHLNARSCRPRKGKGPSSGHGAQPGMPRPRNVAPPAGPAPPAGYYEHHPMHMMPPYTVGMPPVSVSQVVRWLQPMSGRTG
jgi:hypothetical protein